MMGLSPAISAGSFVYGRDTSINSFSILDVPTIPLTPLAMAATFGFGMLFAPSVTAGFQTFAAIRTPRTSPSPRGRLCM
jgi:hypothetical protein